MMTKKIISLLFLSTAFLATSCGEAGVEGDTTFTVSPNKPILIQTDFSYQNNTPTGDNGETTSEEVIVAGAWFRLTYSFTNASSKQVTIVSMKFEATGKYTDGNDVTGEFVFSSSALPVNLDADPMNDQSHILTALPGETKGASDVGLAGIYLHGFPKMPAVTSSRLRIKVTLAGWVGSPSQPVENYEKITYFSTQ